MPDRPPDYDWLYGKGSPGAPDGGADLPADNGVDDGVDDGAESTRLLPKMDRPTSSPPPRTPSPTPRTTTPPPGGPVRRRRIRWGRLVLGIIALWIVFLIAVPLWAWSKIDKVNADPGGHRPGDQPGTNYLLVGSDSREGLTKAENRKLGTGGVGVDGGRTDTILILHTGSGPSMLLSIPRDSLVPIPGHGTTKINAAFVYGGPKLLVKTLEQDTGLHIDHYIEVGLGGFVNVVDAIGGVQICPGHRVNDRRANLHVKKGCQTASGATALGWARSRHAFKLGDIDREKHQRQIIRQIGSGVKSPWTFLNPWRYYQVNKAATTSVKISKGTSPLSMVNAVWAMSRVNGKNGLTCGMPIANLSVQWDHTRALELLRYVKTDRTADIPKGLCTASGLPR